MCALFSLIEEYYTDLSTEYVYIIFFYYTDLSIAEKDSLSTESDTSLLYLDFTVDANMFATDERLQSILMNTVTNVLAKSNGKEKRKEIKATLLPINLGKLLRAAVIISNRKMASLLRRMIYFGNS